MEFTPRDNLFNVTQDVIDGVRERHNLNDPQRLQEAVDILDNWIQKQAHFKKKKFSRLLLEKSIIARKGSVEQAKVLLDRYCTMRTLMPEYFDVYNVKEELSAIRENAICIFTPKLTNEYYRPMIAKLIGNEYTPENILMGYKLALLMSGYLKIHDYSDGIVLILDFLETSITELIRNVNFLEFKQIISIVMEGIGLRVKSVHILTTSKFVETLLSIVKPMLSKKLASRIQTNKSVDELQEYMPQEILPKDYGGKEKSIRALQDEWIDIVSSESYMEQLRDISDAEIDESCRTSSEFNDKYAGMAGTFRSLSID